MMRSFSLLAVTAALSIGMVSCIESVSPGTGGETEEPDFTTVPAPFDTTGKPFTRLENGVINYQVREGRGAFSVVYRDQISVHLTLRRTNGEIVTSTYADSSTSPTVVFVSNMSVEGLKYGMIGMKVDEQRTVVVPPAMGLAGVSENDPNYYLRNDTLLYDLQLVYIAD